MDDVNVRDHEIQRLKVMDLTLRKNKSKESADLYSTIAQSQVLSNRKEDAINLLLQTPSNHVDLYKNYLHACAISATTSQLNFNQTVIHLN
jgi:glutaminase